MQETLAPLRDPRLDHAAILCDLISDIRRILAHPDLGNAGKLKAITEAVDELAPPPAARRDHGGARGPARRGADGKDRAMIMWYFPTDAWMPGEEARSEEDERDDSLRDDGCES